MELREIYIDGSPYTGNLSELEPYWGLLSVSYNLSVLEKLS